MHVKRVSHWARHMVLGGTWFLQARTSRVTSTGTPLSEPLTVSSLSRRDLGS